MAQRFPSCPLVSFVVMNCTPGKREAVSVNQWSTITEPPRPVIYNPAFRCIYGQDLHRRRLFDRAPFFVQFNDKSRNNSSES